MKRRDFIRSSFPVILLLADGSIVKASSGLFDQRAAARLRFAVASDGHYGQPDTTYEADYKRVIEQINEQHQRQKIDFCVINGDIIHNDPSFLQPAKAQLDRLQMRYYVTQGNHDMVNEQLWKATWGVPFNYTFTHGKQAFLFATTSNEKGDYLCPDLDWFKTQLDKYQKAEGIFIFIHITQVKWTKYGIDSPAFIELLSQHKNIRAVFHGHDHTEDDVKTKNNIPFLFDSHIASSWGTPYKGFRMVELMEDGTIMTYMLDPVQKLNERKLQRG